MEDRHVLELCSPAQADKVLPIDMPFNIPLRRRISASAENGKNNSGMIKSVNMLFEPSFEV